MELKHGDKIYYYRTFIGTHEVRKVLGIYDGEDQKGNVCIIFMNKKEYYTRENFLESFCYKIEENKPKETKYKSNDSILFYWLWYMFFIFITIFFNERVPLWIFETMVFYSFVYRR